MSFFKEIDGNVLVVALLPPRDCAQTRQSSELVHGLHIGGLTVQTASGMAPAYCDRLLHFAPKKLFDPILHKLNSANHQLIILLPDALAFEKIDQVKWKHRRIEEFRRLKFLAVMAFKKPKVILALPNRLRSVAELFGVAIILTARLSRPFSVRLVRKNYYGKNLAAKIVGSEMPISNSAIPEQTVFNLAKKSGAMQLTPSWLRKSISDRPDDRLKQELVDLQSVVALLGALPLPFQKPVLSGLTAPIADKVSTPLAKVPISEFMMHLHYKNKQNRNFNLASNTGRLNLLRWYLTKASQNSDHPLPLPTEIFNAFKADCKNRASLKTVAALPQSNSRDVILPAYFLSLYRCYPKKYGNHKLGNNAGRIAFAFQVVVEHARYFTNSDFMGASLNAYFNTSIAGNTANLTRFQLLAAVRARAPVDTFECLAEPWKSEHLSSWFVELANAGYPLLKSLTAKASIEPEIKLHITGTGSFETGLGRNRKMSIKALSGINPARPCFLHHVNADEIPAQILRHNHASGFHIGYLLWELEKLPKSHNFANNLLDEIWAPTKFVQNIYEKSFGRPVTLIGKGFDLPEVKPMDLGPYGFDKNQTIFLSCFDMHSSVARKNPLAAIIAFQRAFPNDPNVGFILKTTPAPQNHWGDPEGQMAKIARIAARDPRIVIDQRMLPFADLLALIRGADCIVSPHRAEGFGYFPAYALKYAKPLVVTDYSGTQDFCTDKTAFPVGFRYRDILDSETIFPVENAKWAEINQDELALAMQNVREDPREAQLRAQNGQALMQDYYSTKALAKRYKTRLSELGIINTGLTERSLNVPMSYEPTSFRQNDSTRNLSPVAEP